MTRNRLPIPIFIVAILAIAVVIAVTSGGSKGAGGQAVPPTSAIAIRQTPVGKVLVDANGRTLYLFAGDRRNVSRLSAAGQSIWPPLTSATLPAATGGASAAQIGAVSATTAARQITYNGHPLYYYVGDQRPGQINGQGLNQFGARWYVLSAAGAAITSAAPTGSASQSGQGGSSSGGTSYSY